MELEANGVGELPCPDCGTISSGTYCPKCGEEMEPRLPTVKHYLHELLHEFAELDSKLVRTIPALFRPGYLTKEYIAGRRQRYLKPLRLYLLVAVLFFILFGSVLKDHIEAPIHGQLLMVDIHGPAAGVAWVRHNNEIVAGHFATIAPYVILLWSTPMFALVLTLLYRNKQRHYIEHLIFSYHFFAFAIIILAPAMLLDSGYLMAILLFGFLVYLFLAMRRVYSDRSVGLILRFLGCTVAFVGLIELAVKVSFWGAILYSHLTGELPPGAPVFF